MTRRKFLRYSVAGAVLASFSAKSAKPKFRAAIIGHTGHGNYGHDHDLVFNNREEIEVVAIADPDAVGRAKAIARSHALQGYADYREMLEKAKPDLVCIAQRWTDEHHAMGMRALQAGAHLYIEKPVTQTLAEADEILALAKSKRLKIALAHQMRLAPNILLLKKKLEEGLIGELLEIRAHGKQDHRAGGEDLIVLGVHLFDLMRFFAGDALWCSARVLQQEHEITKQDAHAATENIGLVAGDDIIGQFAFEHGVFGTFTSRSKNREIAGPWGMELLGSNGSIRINMEMIPRIFIRENRKWTINGASGEWSLWSDDPTLHWDQSERSTGPANARVVDNWLDAIAQDREPVCSGYAAMKALELALSIFSAGLHRTRVEIPLKNRQHPFQDRA